MEKINRLLNAIMQEEMSAELRTMFIELNTMINATSIDKQLTENDINSIKDILYNSCSMFDVSDEEAIKYFNKLHKDIKEDIIRYGASDTPTREKAYLWFKENMFKWKK